MPEPGCVVGIRSSWTCALCRAVAHAFQLIFTGGCGHTLEMPPRWRMKDGVSVCEKHAPVGDKD